MKANQKFMQADDAVSPVIGVILMVAITVVLAAVVFVLVSDLGGGSGESQPAIAWSVSQADNSASVTSADPGSNWDEFEMRVDVLAILTQPDGSTIIWNTDPAPGEFEQLAEGAIGGGDELEFCGAVAGPLTATLRHIDSNSISREFVFSNVEAC